MPGQVRATQALSRPGSMPAAAIVLVTLGMACMSMLAEFDVGTLVRPETGASRPGKAHPLGTDAQGYGLLRQLVARSASYLPHGALAVVITVLTGCSLGSLAGYFSRGPSPIRSRREWALSWMDPPTRYVFELLDAAPRLVVIFLLYAALPDRLRTFYAVSAAVGLTGGMRLGGVIRSEVISLRRRDDIEAAVELGLRDTSIVWRHLLTTRLRPLTIAHAFQVAAEVMLVETTLRFFFPSFGVPNSWGDLLIQARGNVFRSAPYVAKPGSGGAVAAAASAPVRGRGMGLEEVAEVAHLWWLWVFPAAFITANIIALYTLSDAVSGADHVDD